MTYRAKHFILCEKVIQDAQAGNLSAIGILNTLSAVSFPNIYPNFAFLAIVEHVDGTPGKISLKVVRKDAKETVVLAEARDRDLPHAHVQYYGQFPLGITCHEPGPISFTLEVKDEGSDKWYVIAEQILPVNLLAIKEEAKA